MYEIVIPREPCRFFAVPHAVSRRIRTAIGRHFIIEGPHSCGHADEAGWVAARRFALRVFVACGRAAARTPLDSLRGRAWVELLQSLGVGTAAAQCLSMAFFPWLEGGEVKELNETALWGWISSGYSSDLSTWQEWHRDILERFFFSF